VADLIVLAVAALQVAVGEEDGAGAPDAGQRGFLTKVGPCAANCCPISGAAEADLSLKAVYATGARTKGAGREDVVGASYSLGEFTRLLKLYITRFEGCHLCGGLYDFGIWAVDFGFLRDTSFEF
jgi:hypothetical protein